VSENTILFTNITNIVLIILFLIYRARLKTLENEFNYNKSLLYESYMVTCNVICVCARQDNLLGVISRADYIDVILAQPIPDIKKVEHFKFAGIYYEEVKEKINETQRSIFQQMGQKEEQTTKDA